MGSIKSKLIITYLLLIIAMMIFLGLYLSQVIKANYLKDIEEHLKVNALLIREIFSHAPIEGGELQFKVSTLAREIGQRITVIDITGNVLADSEEDPSRMVNHLDRPEIRSAMEHGEGWATRYSITLREDMKYMAVPVKDQDRTVAFIRIALPLTQVSQALSRIRQGVLKGAIAAMLLTALVGLYMANTISKPLVHISEAATAIGEGELSRRIRVWGDDEISRLGQVINQMAGSLQDMVGQISGEKMKLEAVLAHMADGVLAVDSKGSIILLNAAAEEFFGVQRQWAMGKHTLQVIRNKELADALISPSNGQIEIRIHRPNPRQLLCYITPMDGPKGAVCLLRDVTEIRQLEKMRSDFISNVSHELRTPVTSIKGFVDTLLEGPLPDPQTQEHFLKIIQRESDRLVRLLTELSELSKIEAKDFQVELVPTDLAEIIGDSLDVVGLQAQSKGVKLEIAIPEELPRVMTDPDMLSQVFINLLENGIKYTSSGGTVKVLAEAMEDRKIQVKVQDTGIGIPPEDLPRLFERFYRVDKARSRQVGGTGLGLAIVKHILERHESKISVKSQEGKGTEFTFTLEAVREG